MSNDMVVIKWIDAKIYPGIHTESEALERKLDVFESLGYLLSKEKEITIIATERIDNGNFRDVLLIPTGSILSIRELVPRPSV